MSLDRPVVVAVVSLVGGGLGAFLVSHGTAEAVVPAVVTATFIGTSAVARDGNDGLPVMNADCEALDPRARMCRDAEVLHTFPAPVPGVDARVLATVIGRTVSDDDMTPYGLVLAVGVSTEGANCSDTNFGFGELFNDTTPRGVMLSASGNLATASCSSSMVTACCAP